MVITLSDFQAYVRGLDSRLANATLYPDDKINDIISYGVHNLASQAMCFYKSEKTALSEFAIPTDIHYPIEDDIINYYFMGITNSDDKEYPSIGIEAKVLTDNTIQIDIDEGTDVTDLFLETRYFYVPDFVTETSLNVAPEVNHLLKHSIQVVAWGSLKDYEKEQYHQTVFDRHFASTTLSYPNDMPFLSIKGGYE